MLNLLPKDVQTKYLKIFFSFATGVNDTDGKYLREFLKNFKIR
jgi:hypothetical protein